MADPEFRLMNERRGNATIKNKEIYSFSFILGAFESMFLFP